MAGNAMFGMGIKEYASLIQRIKDEMEEADTPATAEIIGKRGGFGTWRQELRTIFRRIGREIYENFEYGSSGGQRWQLLKAVTLKHRTNQSATTNPLNDQGSVGFGKRNSMFNGKKWKNGSEVQMRGLRDAASNAVEGKYRGQSAYSMGRASGKIGVVYGPGGIEYARFQQVGGVVKSLSHGRFVARRGSASPHGVRRKVRVPGRDYMKISDATLNWAEKVISDGIYARLMSMRDFRDLQ